MSWSEKYLIRPNFKVTNNNFRNLLFRKVWEKKSVANQFCFLQWEDDWPWGQGEADATHRLANFEVFLRDAFYNGPDWKKPVWRKELLTSCKADRKTSDFSLGCGFFVVVVISPNWNSFSCSSFQEMCSESKSIFTIFINLEDGRRKAFLVSSFRTIPTYQGYKTARTQTSLEKLKKCPGTVGYSTMGIRTLCRLGGDQLLEVPVLRKRVQVLEYTTSK